MPGYNSSSSMIYALLLLALAHPLAATQPWLHCGQTAGNYEVGSTFETNLQDLLLNTIRQNASSSPSLFAKGSLGAAPDTVWALVLCRRDFSASDCYKCITTAAKGAAGACNRSRDVALYYDPCYVRLSSHDFIDPSGKGNSGLVRVRGVTTISSNDVAGYDQAVTALLNATVQHAVNSSRMFATGQSVGPDPGFANIYSLAQCAPDITPPLCQSCLQILVGDWWNRYPANVRDAVMAGPRCTLRSMLSQFYTGSAMVQLASAPAAVAGTRRGSRTVTMVIGLAVALVAASLLAAGWFWRRRYKSGRQHKTQVKPTGKIQVIPDTSNANMRPSSSSTEKESGQEGDSIVDVPRRFSYEELAQATNSFNENRKLGEGAFGVVYEGRLPGIDMTVAIKANRETSDTAEEKRAFYNEIKIMSQLHHRNILGFWGWCEEDKHLLLVYEIMENGSLEDHLYPRNGTMDTGVYGLTDNGTYSSSHLGWLSRHNILIGIASGLTYLHKECRAAIVHRDLKPANVMLDKNFNAKLADFGLVTQVNHTQTSRPTDNIIGTRSYIDPAYMDTGKVSGQCDVYSLGVILLEIVCGEKPIILQDGHKNSLIEKVTKCDVNSQILDAAEIGLRGQLYDKQIEAVLQLGLQCVLPDRHSRPHTGRVRDRLMEMLPNGKGSTGSTSQPNEDEFGTCRATFRTPSHDDEEAGVSRLISG